MSLKAPKLDDRTFAQLMAEARQLVAQKGGSWTDLSPGDPGVVLLELFAYLTEVMLYRLNRAPEKAYVAFLRLLGVTLQPPAAASVDVTFMRSRPSDKPQEIPEGTRVTAGRGPGGGQEAPIFITTTPAVIPANAAEVTVRAYHCEQIEGELVGTGTGLPGQSYTVRRPPIIAPTGAPLDLVVGVEAAPGELDERIPAREFMGRTYRIWREAAHFTDPGRDDHIYVVDRLSGVITFAPAVQMLQPDGQLAAQATLLAAAPAARREIRVWYRRGGGEAGNVAEERLTVLKDPLPGVTVTNRRRATGGKAAETLANALARGPQELHSLQRAVTAQDFELIARNYGARAVERARAFTRKEVWEHAPRGHVELLLVPDVPEAERERVTLELLQAHESEAVRTQIQAALDVRRPLGATCLVNWARYKKVKVQATVVVQREEDREALQQRLVQRLNQTVTPVITPFNSTGWPFGQALRASHIYDIALAEPGVRWVDRVRLVVEEVPNQRVDALAIDYFQPDTWYAGSGPILFRSLNNGEGWEVASRFAGPIVAVEAHPQRAGLLAVAARRAGNSGMEVRISADCGETWEAGRFATAFNINDLAWAMRDGVPILFLATDVGLYEVQARPGSSPIQILVDPQLPADRGFYAVATYTDVRGVAHVAVAAQSLGGVYLSIQGGQPNSFRKKGANLPPTEDIRVLRVQVDGPRAFLWAGAAALEGSNGSGCYRWELRGTQDPPEGWKAFSQGWQGGSCRDLAFQRMHVFAATHRLGVMRLDASQENAAWQAPAVTCGLPLRDPGRFHPVDAVAGSLPSAAPLVMAGGVAGVYRTLDGGVSYETSSNAEFREKVTLPKTWLFVSYDPEMTVLSEDEAE